MLIDRNWTIVIERTWSSQTGRTMLSYTTSNISIPKGSPWSSKQIEIRVTIILRVSCIVSSSSANTEFNCRRYFAIRRNFLIIVGSPFSSVFRTMSSGPDKGYVFSVMSLIQKISYSIRFLNKNRIIWILSVLGTISQTWIFLGRWLEEALYECSFRRSWPFLLRSLASATRRFSFLA